jgi:hypothetical protein
MSPTPPIYFYLPAEDWPADLPQHSSTYWDGFTGNITGGVYAWVIQTYLRLRESGFPCELVGQFPPSGIVLAHRVSLPFHWQPPPSVLLICLRADYEPHPFAPLHVVQNAAQPLSGSAAVYMPHWPQVGLLPRSVDRGDQFTTIAFFGIEKNLAPQLQGPAWRDQLQAMGLQWEVMDQSRWCDYQAVDATVAIRDFTGQGHLHKPATKLYSAWSAGVPAILGPESAYQAERQSEHDYLEVRTLAATLTALERLRDDLTLRRAIIAQGQRRAQEITPEGLTRRWQDFLQTVAVPRYRQWIARSAFQRHLDTAQAQLNLEHTYLAPRYPHDGDLAPIAPNWPIQRLRPLVRLRHRVQQKVERMSARSAAGHPALAAMPDRPHSI